MFGCSLTASRARRPSAGSSSFVVGSDRPSHRCSRFRYPSRRSFAWRPLRRSICPSTCGHFFEYCPVGCTDQTCDVSPSRSGCSSATSVTSTSIVRVCGWNAICNSTRARSHGPHGINRLGLSARRKPGRLSCPPGARDEQKTPTGVRLPDTTTGSSIRVPTSGRSRCRPLGHLKV
jgi:hypothetical protein